MERSDLEGVKFALVNGRTAIGYVKPTIVPTPVRILAVDPGIANCGWAILRHQGVALDYLGSGTIKTPSIELRHERIAAILNELTSAFHKHAAPRVHMNTHVWVAVENVAIGRNKASALATAAVIGAVEAWSAMNETQCMAFSNSEVKLVVGGAGDADKRLVNSQITRILHLTASLGSDHESDACAIGITLAVKALGFKIPG